MDYLFIGAIILSSILVYYNLNNTVKNIQKDLLLQKPVINYRSNNSKDVQLTGDDLLSVIWKASGTQNSGNLTLKTPTAVDTVNAAKALGLGQVGQKFKFQIWSQWTGSASSLSFLGNDDNSTDVWCGVLPNNTMAVFEVVLTNVSSGSEHVSLALQTLSALT